MVPVLVPVGNTDFMLKTPFLSKLVMAIAIAGTITGITALVSRPELTVMEAWAVIVLRYSIRPDIVVSGRIMVIVPLVEYEGRLSVLACWPVYIYMQVCPSSFSTNFPIVYPYPCQERGLSKAVTKAVSKLHSGW